MLKISGRILLAWLAVAFAVNAQSEPETIPVAASYQSQVFIDADNRLLSTKNWNLVRTARRIEVREGQTGAVWEKLNHDQISYTWLQHEQKMAVYYTPSDLKILDQQPQWTTLATLIEPELLAALELVDSDPAAAEPLRVYRGHFGNSDFLLEWDQALQLPVTIIEHSGASRLEMRLQQVISSDQVPSSFTDIDAYHDLDFADLGDNETDPVVRFLTHGSAVEHQH